MNNHSGRTDQPNSPNYPIPEQGLIEKVHTNVSQELIQVTEDKLQLILVQHSFSLTKREAWIPPLSLLIPILTTLMTARFENYIFTAVLWQAIYIVASIISGLWLLKVLIYRPGKKTVGEIVNEIKGKHL